MNLYITNKFLLTAILILSTLFIVQSEARAESLFLRDGSIIDGKIASENAGVIILKVQNGTKKTIKKDNLIRIVYSNEFRRSTRLSLYDGTLLDGFIVDEDADRYIVRKMLTSKEETIVLKNEVEFIERAKIERRNPVSRYISASSIYMMPVTGELKKYLNPGFGALFNFSMREFFDNNFDGGISLGSIYFPGKDEVAYSVITPLLLNAKYRFIFPADFSIAPSLSAGYSFNYIYSGEPERSPYMVNGSFYTGEYDRSSKYGFEPFTMAGIEACWSLSSDWYVSAGVYHTAIIESSGVFHSVSFTAGCGMKI